MVKRNRKKRLAKIASRNVGKKAIRTDRVLAIKIDTILPFINVVVSHEITDHDIQLVLSRILNKHLAYSQP